MQHAVAVASQRVPLSITVQSPYAPHVDGNLSTTDRYPLDCELGQPSVAIENTCTS